jgi:hypothetical protein
MIFILVQDQRTKVTKTINIAHMMGYWEEGEYTRISLTTETFLVTDSLDDIDEMIDNAIKKGMRK